MKKYTILEKIRDCSKVGFHAWYKTDLGVSIRKPIIPMYEEKQEDKRNTRSV